MVVRQREPVGGWCPGPQGREPNRASVQLLPRIAGGDKPGRPVGPPAACEQCVNQLGEVRHHVLGLIDDNEVERRRRTAFANAHRGKRDRRIVAKQRPVSCCRSFGSGFGGGLGTNAEGVEHHAEVIIRHTTGERTAPAVDVPGKLVERHHRNANGGRIIDPPRIGIAAETDNRRPR